MNTSDELRQFIARCDPGRPADQMEYVPRAPSVSERLSSTLRALPRGRVLVMGQNGVGKSTELQRYAGSEAQQSGFVVLKPPLDVDLSMEGLSWHELLLFTVAWATSFANLAPSQQQPGPVLKALSLDTPQQLLSQMSHQPGIVRSFIASNRHLVWETATGALLRLQEYTHRPLLVIWDGLEKLTTSRAQALFYQEGRFIEELPCRTVVVAPLSLSFEPYFHDVEVHFDSTERLRATPPNEPLGLTFLTSILTARGLRPGAANVAAAFINREDFALVFRQLVNSSGGIPRQLLRVAAEAARQALVAGSAGIVANHVQLALRHEAERFRYQLSPEDIAELRRSDSARQPAAKARLLGLLALLEYELPNGDVTVESNPLLSALLGPLR